MAHIRPAAVIAAVVLGSVATLTPPVVAEVQIFEPVVSSVDGTYLVSFAENTSGQTKNEVLAEADIDVLENVASGTVLVAADSKNEVEELLADPAVVAVEPDQVVSLEQAARPTTPDPATNWVFDRGSSYGANLPVAPVTSTSTSRAYVGVLDTGIDISHPAIAPYVWQNTREVVNGVDDDGNGFADDVNGWDFASNVPYVGPSLTDETHGTSVAGVLALTTSLAGRSGSLGIIPGKFFKDGQGKVSDAIKGINYMVDLKYRQRLNIVAINASWTHPTFTYALRDAIWDAGDAGILVTAAGAHYEDGNGEPIAHYPAAHSCAPWWHPSWDCVVSVTAHDDDGQLPEYAGRNATQIDLSAPGEWLVAPIPGNSYRISHGTSLATPIVASAIAMCRAPNPTMTAETALNLLYASVTPTASLKDTTMSGGRLNIAGYLNGCTSNGAAYGEQNSVTIAGAQKLKVTGWARSVDPATPVTITVDGVPVATVVADQSRLDRGAATKNYGAPSGYETTISTAPGIRQICSVPAGGAPQCTTVRVGEGRYPTGFTAQPTLSQNQWEITGWALDPETSSSVTVELWVDGTLRDSTPAYEPHAEFSAQWPGWKEKGFRLWWNREPGKTQTLCVIARDIGTNTGVPIGCQRVTSPAGNNPIGNVEVGASQAGSQIYLSGWALDPDTADSTAVHVYVNNRFAGATSTTVSRSDVKRVFPAYNDLRGFSVKVPATSGVNQVCAYGINVVTGTTNSLIGCRSVTVRTGNPLGSFDQASVQFDRRIAIRGWTLDPDTTAPIKAHVYVDGRYAGQGTANTWRPDVGRVYPGYGDSHGYSILLGPQAPGTHTICVYGINVGAGTFNPQLGCRMVTVP